METTINKLGMGLCIFTVFYLLIHILLYKSSIDLLTDSPRYANNDYSLNYFDTAGYDNYIGPKYSYTEASNVAHNIRLDIMLSILKEKVLGEDIFK